MNRTTKLILVLLAIVAGAWLAYRTVDSWYLTPRGKLIADIQATRARLANYAKARQDERRLDTELKQIVDHTLGGERETVDHTFRSRLNRIGEQLKLLNVAVGTGSAVRAKDSPAKSVFSSGSQKALRDEIDYMELEGWISGTGTFEQVLRLVDAVESEPWIKRIDQLKLDPKQNGERFDVTLRLTTLFLPKRSPATVNTNPPTNANFDKYMTFVATNPFRVPPPPPVAAQPNPKPNTDLSPPAKPTFPYEQWALTGVAQSASGPEVWLLNQKSRESRRLVVGESLEEVVLVAAAGDSAEFRLGEQRFVIAVGKFLSDRSPVNQ
jgi:hypothetical protein